MVIRATFKTNVGQYCKITRQLKKNFKKLPFITLAILIQLLKYFQICIQLLLHNFARIQLLFDSKSPLQCIIYKLLIVVIKFKTELYENILSLLRWYRPMYRHIDTCTHTLLLWHIPMYRHIDT